MGGGGGGSVLEDTPQNGTSLGRRGKAGLTKCGRIRGGGTHIFTGAKITRRINHAHTETRHRGTPGSG